MTSATTDAAASSSQPPQGQNAGAGGDDGHKGVVGGAIKEGEGGIKQALAEGKGWSEHDILAYAKTIGDNHPMFAESLEVNGWVWVGLVGCGVCIWVDGWLGGWRCVYVCSGVWGNGASSLNLDRVNIPHLHTTGDGPRDDRGDPGHQVRGEELPVSAMRCQQCAWLCLYVCACVDIRPSHGRIVELTHVHIYIPLGSWRSRARSTGTICLGGGRRTRRSTKTASSPTRCVDLERVNMYMYVG